MNKKRKDEENMFNKIASIINTHLGNNNYMNKKERAYLQFGLKIFLLLITELIIILFLSYILNIFWPVVFALSSFLFIRPYAGGVHMPSYLLCMLVSLLIFLGIGIISISINLNIYLLITWIITVFTIGYILINKYAPADTDTIPIKDPVQRKLLKAKAIRILFIWFINSLITTLLLPNHLHVIFASSLGILSNIILVHPLLFELVQKYLPEHK